MKILVISNYDDDTYEPHFFSVEGSTRIPQGIVRELCSCLNAINPTGPHYYSPVEDDHVIDWKDPRE